MAIPVVNQSVVTSSIMNVATVDEKLPSYFDSQVRISGRTLRHNYLDKSVDGKSGRSTLWKITISLASRKFGEGMLSSSIKDT